MKKCFLFFFVVICMLQLCASAESDPFKLTYNKSKNEKVVIEWGIAPDQLPSEMKPYASYEGRTALWSNPNRYAPDYSGYYANVDPFPSVEFQGLRTDDYTLYFCYQYDETGISNREKNKSQLYLVEFNLDPAFGFRMDETTFNSLLDHYNAIYGKPLFTEDSSKGILMTSGGVYNTTTYHREYVWNGPENTGLRITGNYESWDKAYADVKVYLGKTDIDATLKNGKLTNAPAYIEVTTKAESVLLRDSKGNLIQDLKKGTHVFVTGYDAQMDKFSAICSDSKKEGYISGKGLTISKEELLAYFY